MVKSARNLITGPIKLLHSLLQLTIQPSFVTDARTDGQFHYELELIPAD